LVERVAEWRFNPEEIKTVCRDCYRRSDRPSPSLKRLHPTMAPWPVTVRGAKAKDGYADGSVHTKLPFVSPASLGVQYPRSFAFDV
jgi:hypothetical protein